MAPYALHVRPPCMKAMTPSVAASQYIDIYIVFPLGCSQGARGGWTPGAVTGSGIKRLHFLWVFLQTPGCTTPSASDGYEGLMAGWQMLAL
ncbi:Phosphoribosylformylglycinamidine synthase subunit PurQ [Dissostichus eleginoides]|uniref:Phosphoribosylformylglycinamidine synthase subunit PurQ n=1 Tax=Dissostichus eleginoides TaxID=100907 RepID=A0AAD9F074_DISEL|nr:Phosphoribosylformylglycinamidine synthase subunit PurQ [Dissostichus eleginoides]